MKALTLTQPWATLVAIRAKRLETRSWPTRYRGRLAIHAAKGYPAWARVLAAQEPFRSALAAFGFNAGNLPCGAVVAYTDLTDCFRIPAEPRLFPLRHLAYFNGGVWLPPHEPELSFGDYTAGRYAFYLDHVRPLPEPIPARGALGLWDWVAPEGAL